MNYEVCFLFERNSEHDDISETLELQFHELKVSVIYHCSITSHSDVYVQKEITPRLGKLDHYNTGH